MKGFVRIGEQLPFTKTLALPAAYIYSISMKTLIHKAETIFQERPMFWGVHCYKGKQDNQGLVIYNQSC